MNEFNKLYEFIRLAQKNRKYPPNTAHGRRAALRLFETVLHAEELESLTLIEERMKEIYLSLISRHKDTFSIQSLNTYKGRFLKVIRDYKRYGIEPGAINRWEVKLRKYKNRGRHKDMKEDMPVSNVSLSVHRPVHKIQVSLANGTVCSLELPSNITQEDASLITKIIGSLVDR